MKIEYFTSSYLGRHFIKLTGQQNLTIIKFSNSGITV